MHSTFYVFGMITDVEQIVLDTCNVPFISKTFYKPFLIWHTDRLLCPKHSSYLQFVQQAYDFSLRTKPTEVMLSELIFLLLFLKLTKTF